MTQRANFECGGSEKPLDFLGGNEDELEKANLARFLKGEEETRDSVREKVWEKGGDWGWDGGMGRRLEGENGDVWKMGWRGRWMTLKIPSEDFEWGAFTKRRWRNGW
jgi:hypothetical protein